MSKRYLLTAATLAALTLACSAQAQFGVPPPGSAEGMESGTYGSSIGFDVRGTGRVDRFGRPNDPFNSTDTAQKPVDPREKRDTDTDRIGVPGNARGPGDSRGNAGIGANMNPGLAPGAVGGANPSLSPNLNPGTSLGTGIGNAGPGSSGNAGGGNRGSGAPGTSR